MKLSETYLLSKTSNEYPVWYCRMLRTCTGEPFTQYIRLNFIYKITCLGNGKSYIGRAYNPYARGYSHLAALRHNRHLQKPMQDDFDKYGEESFSFEILNCECFTFEESKEKFYQKVFKTYSPKHGYNTRDQYWNRSKMDEVKCRE